jgi:osmotically-inducible protein OsmY
MDSSCFPRTLNNPDKPGCIQEGESVSIAAPNVNPPLLEEVKAELAWHPVVRHLVIGVEVQETTVTLTGRASSEAERRAAEIVTWGVRGVRMVYNRIEVYLPSPGLTDEALAETAMLCLRANALIPADGWQVSVRGGWLTLNGQMPWRYQCDEALRVLGGLRGVAGVIDLLHIAPSESAAHTQQQIEAALQRCACLDAQWIIVEAYKGRVVLRGSVRSWLEREQAEQVAWCAPGVVEVMNHLVISL